MYGAFIGDIAGTGFEYLNSEPSSIVDSSTSLITSSSHISDDSVMTVAVMDLLLHGVNLNNAVKETSDCYRKWCRRFLNPSWYGSFFYEWIRRDDYKTYQSLGNGGAMRISPLAYWVSSLEEIPPMVEYLLSATHSSIEALEGAKVLASCIYLARKGKSKKEISDYAKKHYPLNYDYDDLVLYYFLNASARTKETVPLAIYCFLISDSFEDCLIKCINLKGDIDTISSMSLALAEAYYKEVPNYLIDEALEKIEDEKMIDVIATFNEEVAKRETR